MKKLIVLGCNPLGLTTFAQEKFNEATKKTIESFDRYNSITKTFEVSEPKSKYINKPKRNYKR